MVNITTLTTLDLSSLIGLFFGIMVVLIILLIAIYIYFSLALMFIAKRTNTSNAWLAWIPYANIFLITKIAQKHWWPILLILIPLILNFFPKNIIFYVINYISIIALMIFYTIWWWKICERRSKPGWWALVVLIPLIGWIWGLIMIGILAWEKNNNIESIPVPKPQTS